jgi:hypothetical protein
MSELIERAPDDRWGWAGDTALWFGVLGGPIIWAAHLQILYCLVPVYCRTGSALWMHVTSVACVVVSVAAGLTAWSCLSRARAGDSPTDEEVPAARPHFMALLGVANSALFTLIIIATAIASFMIDPCWL